ncbi:MAG TPA: hemerythrin domain-containing protein [Bacteroidota bacterium]|nr:hemerythrin domain-containing protein [Bacteroidota bacterium]
MRGPLHQFFADDHRRLEALLDKATSSSPAYDMAAYAQFRSGLLKHIKMEETILLPAAQRAQNGKPLDMAARIRLDHGAITALLVPPPSPMILRALRAILAAHDMIEEQPSGMYERLEELTGAEMNELVDRAKKTTDVPVHPHNEASFILDATRRALARAGYNLDDYA